MRTTTKLMRQATLAGLLLVVMSGVVNARSLVDHSVNTTTMSPSVTPAHCIADHNIGQLTLGVSNNGSFGMDYSSSGRYDCFTGVVVRPTPYPKGNHSRYLFGGALWIGAVVGQDTLVSVGQDGWYHSIELHPDESPIGDMIPNVYGGYHQGYTSTYTDTFLSVGGLQPDYIEGTSHTPIWIEVEQTTHAWAFPIAEDFVMFDQTLRNIGPVPINDLYIGVFVDADVHYDMMGLPTDDISGHISETQHPLAPKSCPTNLDLNLSWTADNDGDLIGLPGTEVPHVTGTALLGPTTATVSHNWWVSNQNAAGDYGPMTYAKYRDLSTGGTGTPEGDRNKYWYLSNGEIDPDQAFITQIPDDDPIWMPPNETVESDLADGGDTRYLLSFGPISLAPGETQDFAFVYVAGRDLHSDPNNLDNLPDNPEAFYDNLDFSDLILNTAWAKRIYDNPGVDTDSDGFAGTFVVCDSDTIWTEGDGVPDFRPASLPPAPTFWAASLPSALHFRWNGHSCETARDEVSGEWDFEGYEVLVDRVSYPYDVEDYFRYYWDDSCIYEGTIGRWMLSRERFTADDLRCLYAPGGCHDSSFLPYAYTEHAPLSVPGAIDSLFYFASIGCNMSEFGHETIVTKRYPAAPLPPYSRPEDVPQDSADYYLTSDGYFKYYEYGCTISGLFPDHQYGVQVASFDYGALVPGGQMLSSSSIDNNLWATTLPGKIPCCVGATGNIDGDAEERVDITDLTAFIDYLFVSNRSPVCLDEANMDGHPTIDIGDLTALIDYLFISFTPPVECP